MLCKAVTVRMREAGWICVVGLLQCFACGLLIILRSGDILKDEQDVKLGTLAKYSYIGYGFVAQLFNVGSEEPRNPYNISVRSFQLNEMYQPTYLAR